MDPPHNPTPVRSSLLASPPDDPSRNVASVSVRARPIDSARDPFPASSSLPAQSDFAATDLQSLYESLSSGPDLDSADILQNESAQPGHAGLINISATVIPLPTPTYLEDGTLVAPASPTAPKTPQKRTPDSSGGGARTRASRALSAERSEDHLERIRKKNREAATKFRQRQRDLGSSLEAKIAELSYEQTDLLEERDNLQSEAMALTSQLSALQCLTAAHPSAAEAASPTALGSPGLPLASLPQAGYNVGYVDFLAGDPAASGAPVDVGLPNVGLPDDFSIEDLAVPTSDEYGCYSSQDPMSMSDGPREDQP